MSLDLSQYDAIKTAQDEGRPVEILDPRGRPIGMSIWVAGPDSDRVRNAREAQVDERINRRQTAPVRAAQLNVEGLQYLAAITIKWAGHDPKTPPSTHPDAELRPVRLGENEYPYSESNALALYQRYSWIAERVDNFAGDRVNFMEF